MEPPPYRAMKRDPLYFRKYIDSKAAQAHTRRTVQACACCMTPAELQVYE